MRSLSRGFQDSLKLSQRLQMTKLGLLKSRIAT